MTVDIIVWLSLTDGGANLGVERMSENVYIVLGSVDSVSVFGFLEREFREDKKKLAYNRVNTAKIECQINSLCTARNVMKAELEMTHNTAPLRIVHATN